MKVAFNSLPLTTGHKYRGIGTYTKNLLAALKAKDSLEIQEFGQLNEISSADVVHFTTFDLFQGTMPLINKYSTIVTIHDVIPLMYPQQYPAGFKGAINLIRQRFSLQSVKAIITDSQASKNEIVKYLGVPSSKIFPISLAPSSFYKPIDDQKQLKEIKDKYKLPEKFSVFIGNVNWNKNLLNLTKGVLDAGVELVLVGSSFENQDNLNHPELRSYARFLKEFQGNDKIHVLGFVPDEDIACVVNMASSLLLPSYAEGFGLPILDAQSCGVPVITSNVSSLPEVAGKEAILVDPNNPEEITKAVSIILNDNKVRDQLISGGFENVKKFSWEKCADETMKVYQHVVNS